MQIPTARQLMQEAELDTGLLEWTTGFTGDPFTVLDILVNDLNSHSRLHALGAQRMYRRLHENLCARLKYITDRKRHPQVDEETIAAPLFILGLPRSGTTLLHNLLGAAPHNRAPRSDADMSVAAQFLEPVDQEFAAGDDVHFQQADGAQRILGLA